MEYKLALIKGDGIGPEIVDSAVEVLDAVGKRFGHRFSYVDCPAGGCAIDRYGVPLPEQTVADCKNSDSVLLGAVGGPKWDDLPGHLRPERALLGVRAALGLYNNIRPVKIFPALRDASPLRSDIVEKGIDFLLVRELPGGIYFGQRGRREGKYGPEAYDTECYSVFEVERIARAAFAAARGRKKQVVSVDKANVLESSRLWRETVHRVAAEYPDVACRDLLVDNAAMQLVRDPGQFDVVVTSNMFGDILSDEASQLTGSIGLLPSASLGDTRVGMYEPIHGSAPDIAGRGIANPIATILSAAMLLRYSLELAEEAAAVESAVERVLDAGLRTADLRGKSTAPTLNTAEMTRAILDRLP